MREAARKNSTVAEDVSPLRLCLVLLGICLLFSGRSSSQAAAPPAQPKPDSCKYSGAQLGLNGRLGGVLAFPDSHWSRQPISAYPKDPGSDALICIVDTERPCGHNLWPHPSFGSSPENGIPYYVVDNSQPMVPVTITTYAEESDPSVGLGMAPLPNDPTIIESYRKSDADHHVLIINKDSCWLYEFNKATFNPATKRWTANGAAIWDLSNNSVRPIGWTSADASGLPIFPTLVKYEEAHSGVIRHVIRGEFTNSRAAFVPPASHYTTSGMGSNFPPMGMRWRLKPNFDTTLGGRATKEVHAILEAMKTYGLINQDNSGGGFFIDGVPDPRWDDETLHNQLASIHINDFEFVTTEKTGAPTRTYGPEGKVRDLPSGSGPKILSFKADADAIEAGRSVELTYSTKGASYLIIGPDIGPLRGESGSVKVHPRTTTTYILSATNGFGREVRSKRIKVKGGSYSWDSPTNPLLALWDIRNTGTVTCSAKCSDGAMPITVHDSSGNGHVLKLSGAVTYTSGTQGLHGSISAISFSGGNGSISPPLAKQDSYTIVAVFRPKKPGVLLTGSDAESGYVIDRNQLLVDTYRRTDGGGVGIGMGAFHQSSVSYDHAQIRFRLDAKPDRMVHSAGTAQSLGFFLVGASQSGGYQPFQGDLAALAIYKGSMNLQELTSLEAFIASMY